MQIDQLASKINKDLVSLRQDIEFLTNSLSYKIPFDKALDAHFDELYSFSNNKSLVYKSKERKSAVYITNKTGLNESLKKFIVNSQVFDDLFKKLVDQNILLSQIYFLKDDGFIRIFPYVDIDKFIAPNFDLLQLESYRSTKEKPFVENSAYWNDQAFADPFGRGWIITCTEPVYYRNNYIGSLSGNLSVNELKLNYLSSNKDAIILVNSNFELIAATKKGEEFLSIPSYREYQYYKPISENTVLYKHSYLLDNKNESFKASIHDIRSGKEQSSFYYKNKKYSILSYRIEETAWYLLKIIN